MDSYARAAELVFIPAPFTGHLFSTVEIAKLLINRDQRLSITILIINLPFDSNASAYASSLAATFIPTADQRIHFIALPQIDLEKFTFSTSPSASAKRQAMIAGHKHLVSEAVSKLRCDGVGLIGFVVDMVCVPMIDAASQFGLPTYLYFTFSAATLGLSLHLRSLYDEHGQRPLTELIDSDAELIVPGFINAVPVVRSFPYALTDAQQFTHFINMVARFKETKGILINTFEELEPHALKAISEAAHNAPKVYPVGPILNLDEGSHHEAKDQDVQKERIMAWLDGQPPSSVVFLCFGSMGSFDEEQVKEIAVGLERSGHKFLWSLRKPPPRDEMTPGDYVCLEEVLPEGFLERTSELGMVIGWAPQVAVLSHPAIGGFVSHCGWNSILEGLWFGVPVATWPVYSEQQLNAFTMVKELGLALELTLYYTKDLFNDKANFIVSAEDVARGVRNVMQKHSMVREKVKAMREASRMSLIEGGSSYSFLDRFIEDVINNMP